MQSKKAAADSVNSLRGRKTNKQNSTLSIIAVDEIRVKYGNLSTKATLET